MSRTRPKEVAGGVVAGRRPVAELLRARRRAVRQILIGQGASLPRDLEVGIESCGVPIDVRPMPELTSLANTEAHQGVVALAEPLPSADVRELAGSARLLLALDGVEDPRNLGAVIRAADAAGAAGLVLSKRHGAPLTATALKAAAGAAEWVPIARVANITQALQSAKEAGMWVVGLEADADPVGRCALLQERVVLVAGSEGGGLRRLVRDTCDALCGIPMWGAVGSLNVATAVAVAAFCAIGLKRERVETAEPDRADAR